VSRKALAAGDSIYRKPAARLRAVGSRRPPALTRPVDTERSPITKDCRAGVSDVHGVPMVSVNWHNDGKYFWDTHGDNFNRLKNDLIPPADRALSALLDDLEERGLLDETLIAWVGEFGRRPTITAGNAGREHWPNCYSGLEAGGWRLEAGGWRLEAGGARRCSLRRQRCSERIPGRVSGVATGLRGNNAACVRSFSKLRAARSPAATSFSLCRNADRLAVLSDAQIVPPSKFSDANSECSNKKTPQH
jgi:hypothetical protein